MSLQANITEYTNLKLNATFLTKEQTLQVRPTKFYTIIINNQIILLHLKKSKVKVPKLIKPKLNLVTQNKDHNKFL